MCDASSAERDAERARLRGMPEDRAARGCICALCRTCGHVGCCDELAEQACHQAFPGHAATRSSKATIRRKAGAGAMSTRSCSISATTRTPQTGRFRGLYARFQALPDGRRSPPSARRRSCCVSRNTAGAWPCSISISARLTTASSRSPVRLVAMPDGEAQRQIGIELVVDLDQSRQRPASTASPPAASVSGQQDGEFVAADARSVAGFSTSEFEHFAGPAQQPSPAAWPRSSLAALQRR